MKDWKINPNDVGFSFDSSSGGGTFERKTKITSRRLRLTHIPTKITVHKEIPPGHYSKKEMKQLTEKLKEQMYKDLEKVVAKHLRIPGR